MSIHTVCLWLIEFLDTSPPRLIRDVKREADVHGIPPQLLNSAAKALPLIRRPKVVRGPWTWQLPQPAELVRVCYFCPVIGCGKTSEGWMEFRLSRILFSAGLIRYVTSGTARRTLSPECSSIFLRLARRASLFPRLNDKEGTCHKQR